MAVTAFRAHDHRTCAETALAHAERVARRDGLRLTPVRRRVLEILLERHRAWGAYELLDRLADEGLGKQPPVVYRALDFLVANGLAHRVRRLNAFTACLGTHAPDQSPAFLICETCRAVAEIDAAELRTHLDHAAERSGFVVSRSTLEAVGRCAGCVEQPG